VYPHVPRLAVRRNRSAGHADETVSALLRHVHISERHKRAVADCGVNALLLACELRCRVRAKIFPTIVKTSKSGLVDDLSALSTVRRARDFAGERLARTCVQRLPSALLTQLCV